MIIRFNPPLPCDVHQPGGALCGKPAHQAVVRCDLSGWHITPICRACARRLIAARHRPRTGVQLNAPGGTP
jgi:hypothetical protein